MSERENSIQGTINAVPFDEAMQMTARWQELVNPETNDNYPKSYSFSSIDFREILKEDRVKTVRIYPAIREDGSVTLLAVGADETNTDIIQIDSDASGIYDFATPCPNTCGNSPLNHDSVNTDK